MKKIYSTIFLITVFVLANSLAVNAQNTKETIQQMIDKVSVDNLTTHIKVLEEAGGTRSRITFTPGVDSAAFYVKEVFDGFSGLTSVELDTFYISYANAPYNNKPQVNVVATIEGKKHPEQVYVLGAHLDATADRDYSWDDGANWDTIEAPGADDNASGIASLLEIARILTDPANNFSSDYTLKLVAFGAEERGANYPGNHHGSTHYAQRLYSSGSEILGMIAVDMIGFNNSYNYASIVKVENGVEDESVTLGEELISANDNFSIGLYTNNPPFASGTYSDHESFAKKGFPSVLVIENAPWNNNYYYRENPYYHTSIDTYETLNMEQVKKITQLSLATMASFSGISTGIEDENPDLASNIRLNQNYPNPFNPSTVISYQLPANSAVQLAVFDMMGRKVATLVDGEIKTAGEHEITFDAGHLASGMYVYRLQTDQFATSKKMVLMK